MRKISRAQVVKLEIAQAISTMLVRSRELGLSLSTVRSLSNQMHLKLIKLGAVAVEPIDWSKATAAKKIFDGLEKAMPSDADYASPIDFLMVVGDGRDDEVIFRWANELDKTGTVANVTTVSLGSRNTEAGYTLTQGVTGTHSTTS